MNRCQLFIVSFLLFANTLPVAAESISVIAQPDGTSFMVQGQNFSNVGGVEMVIEYDTATLANPRIAQGSLLSAAMFVPNPTFSSSAVKIAAMSLSAIKGNGTLATIAFDRKGQTEACVSMKSVKLTTTTAGRITPAIQPVGCLKSLVDTGSQVAESGGGGSAGVGVTSGSAIVSGVGEISGSVGVASGTAGGPSIGTITLPPDQMASSSERKSDYQPLVTDLRKDLTAPAGDAQAASTNAGQQAQTATKEQEKKYVAHKGVLQLFGGYKGERGVKNLLSLFAEAEIPGFIQEPPIALADGISTVQLKIKLKSGGETPRFIMQGGSVQNLNNDAEEGVWFIDALPKPGTYDAKLTVIDGPVMTDYPLTVAPKIDPLLTKGQKLSEADFVKFLAKPAKYDLNKDDKFDAIDDFIYTANYILAMNIKPEKLKKEESKPATKDEGKIKEAPKKIDDKAKGVEKPVGKVDSQTGKQQ